MHTRLLSSPMALLLALGTTLAVAPRAAAAQQMRQVIEGPEALDAADPRGKLASELVERLVTKDRAAAEAFIAENAVPGYAGSTQMKTQLDKVAPAQPAKEFKITALQHGMGEDVLVRTVIDGTPQAFAVLFKAEQPNRIAGIIKPRLPE